MRFQVLWLASVSSLVYWLMLAADVDSEQIDSEWAVGKPSPVASASISADERQLLMDHLVGIHAPPMLKPVAVQSILGQSVSTARFTSRPNGVEGWRPASEPLATHSNLPKPTLVPASPRKIIDDPPLPNIELKFRPARIGAPVTAPSAADPPFEAGCDGLTEEECGFGDGPTITPDLDEPTYDAATTDDDTPASDTADAETAPSPPPLSRDDVGRDDTLPELAPPSATRPLPPLTRQLVHLRARVRSVLTGYYRKTLNSRDHDPWEVMHGMLAYGVHSRIRPGGPRGKPVTSVGWLCFNKPCKGQTLMHLTRYGELRAKYGVGLQGHLGQLLAMLAQCQVSPDYPIRIGSREFTIHDLIEAEKTTCYPDSELTFKLIALQYYLDLNKTWVNDQGDPWDFPRLVREELAQPIRGAACGGTHRLSGLSLTVKRRLARGEPLDGEYALAADFVQKYHQYAFRLQNRDGSLSTSWFQGRGDEDDIDRRIKTTGHILEWLCYSLSDEELRDQRTIRAVSYLANLMYSNYDHEWEVGPVSHATHALLLYDERVFVPYDSPEYSLSYRPKPAMATRTQPNSTRR
ncbi:MAG TPA: hypothetical protein VGK58_22590 [Lacipirellulaceae bacterium]